MPKIKMSDIKSGSENVKNVFRTSMSNRTKKWLTNKVYTNNELLEILELCEVERHNDKRFFYQNLIDSQKGPFNADVFNNYKSVLFHTSSLMNLLTNSKGVNDIDKTKWIVSAILTNSHWFLNNVFINNVCIKYGMDIKKKPFNLTMAKSMVEYNHTLTISAVTPVEYSDYLREILNTLSDDELYDWYISSVSKTYKDNALFLLMSYPNTTEKILRHYYEKSKMDALASHPNFPPEIRLEIFKRTKDEKYLPKEAQDIFLF